MPSPLVIWLMWYFAFSFECLSTYLKHSVLLWLAQNGANIVFWCDAGLGFSSDGHFPSVQNVVISVGASPSSTAHTFTVCWGQPRKSGPGLTETPWADRNTKLLLCWQCLYSAFICLPLIFSRRREPFLTKSPLMVCFWYLNTLHII